MSGQKTHRPGGIVIPPGSGMDKGRTCTCWPKPDDPHPCTPQTCDWRCRACRIHGRPFYSRGDLQYLEHGTGPLAAELERLWRIRGAGKRRTVREPAGHDADRWPALPQGAAGLGPRRLHTRTVTDLYYPGLQDPHQAMAAATPAGAVADVSVAAWAACLAGLRRAVGASGQQLLALSRGRFSPSAATTSWL